MSRLHEPIQDHIHRVLSSEVNEVIIGIKLHHIPIEDQSAEQQAKIGEARKNHPKPSWQSMVELLDRVRDELDSCTQPFKRYL